MCVLKGCAFCIQVCGYACVFECVGRFIVYMGMAVVCLCINRNRLCVV